MKRLALRLAVVLSMVALFACDTKAFNASFCKSYQESFLKECTETCTKAGRTACDCKGTLAKDQQYVARCAGMATPTASTATPAAPH